MGVGSSFAVLRRRTITVLVVLAIVLLAGVALNFFATVKYRASAEIFVSTENTTDASQLAQGNTFALARVQSYTSVATSPKVLQPVISDLKLPMTTGELAAEISANAPLNKVLVDIYVTDKSASRAAEIANAVATQFSAVIEEIEQTGTSAVSPVKLSVIHPAVIPTAPTSPRVVLNLAIAAAIGLVLGVISAYVKDTLDNTIKSPFALSDITKAPTMAVVPWDKKAPDATLAFRTDLHSSRAEAFRQLRTNLQFVGVDRPTRVIAVTSALPGEGKTHTTLNLAAALAEGGKRVCVIEADLRKPTISASLGLVGTVGLTSVLVGSAQIEDVLQNAGRNLAVLAAGPIPPNPFELLASDQFRALTHYLEERVDIVIIDTAPLLPVADGAEVASQADVTLLTVRAGKTTKDQVRRAVEALERVGVHAAGAILSMTTSGRGSADSYYYYHYRPNEPKRAAERVLPVSAEQRTTEYVDALDGNG